MSIPLAGPQSCNHAVPLEPTQPLATAVGHDTLEENPLFKILNLIGL